MNECRMLGCGLATSGYSTFCATHKRTQRRHGHPAQSGVTVHELRPLVSRVKARMTKNAGNPTWAILRSRWEALVGIAKGEMVRYQGGTPMSRYEAEAWSNVEKIGAVATDTEVLETVLAMYLLQEESPHRFRSDGAFSGQLVRRVRTLAPSNAGEYYDQKTGKNKRVYRDAKPKTVAILAGLLRETFGAAGLIVAKLEQREVNKKTEEMLELHAALEELK
jgi:hypothetical protein